MTREELMALNVNLKTPESLTEGMTILIPAGKLSSRDRDIISGIQFGRFRLYPVRKGEALEDIMGKRKISRQEMEEINPGVDLEHIADGQVLKLPASKFTVREREMLSSIGAPSEFFSEAKTFGAGILLGGVCFGAATYFYLKNKGVGEEEE